MSGAKSTSRYSITHRRLVIWNMTLGWLFLVVGIWLGILIATFLPNAVLVNRLHVLGVTGGVMFVLVLVPLVILAKLRPALISPFSIETDMQQE